MCAAREEELFLAVLRAALRGNTVDPEDLPADIDWEKVIALSFEQKLFPMIISAVPHQHLPNYPLLKQKMILQVAVQTVKSSEFMALYNEIRNAGFHPLVVKGIVCRSLYPQGDLRPSSDEDLYVSDQEFSECCDFLRAYGMVPIGESCAEAFEIGWRKPGSQLYIELHRRFFAPDSGAYGELEGFFNESFRNATAYPTEFGAPVYSLSAHDHMLYLLLHAYKHFLHSGFGIRQICDIGLWAAKYGDRIDWCRLARQCQRCIVDRFAQAVLGIAFHVLQIPMVLPSEWCVPREYCAPLLSDVLSGGVYGSADSDRQHSATVTLHAVEADRSGGSRSIWQSVFLKRTDMEKKYPYLKKCPLLLPVAWAQRIVQYLLRNRNAREHLSASIAIGNERIQLFKYYGIIRDR